jgi:hypothetical protein
MKKYYVYIYLDPRKEGNYAYGEYAFKYEPFYIGKGCRHRHSQHLSKSNLKRYNKNPRTQKILKLLSLELKPIIIKVEQSLTNDEAYNLEEKLILLIGRKDLGTGCLLNCNKGGKQSEIDEKELRLKISNGQKKKPDRSGKNNPMYGVHRFGVNSPHYGRLHSEETKKKMANKHSGGAAGIPTRFKKGHKTWNSGTKGLQVSWNKGKQLTHLCKSYSFIKDDKEIIIHDLQRYCLENNLPYGTMVRIYTKGRSYDKKKPYDTVGINYYKGYSSPNFPIPEK